MLCKSCGKLLVEGTMFCPQCGTPISNESANAENQMLYKLSENSDRKYSITVNRKDISVTGKFWYLKDKEFEKCKSEQESAQIQNFVGMGYLAKRSFKKCLLFILAGSLLEIVKLIVDKVAEWIDKANDYLQWIDRTITLPEWMTYTLNTITAICILLGIVFLFSKKKVIEISFTDKRICVPQKSMSKNEYNMLFQSIQNAKKNM